MPGKRTFALSSIASATLFAASMLAPASAAADTIDFGIVAPSTGSISFAGGNAPLIGTGIEVDNIVGIGTPLNANATAVCVGCILSFETGNLTGFSSSLTSGVDSWEFGPGGTVSITGAVDFDGSGGTPDLSQRTLLTGTFSVAEVIKVDSSTLLFTIAVGSFLDTKDPDLLAFYGLPNTQYIGGMNVSFGLATNAIGGDPFASDQIFSGDVVNAVVPVPAALPLFGSALGFLALFRRRLRAA